MNVPPGYIMIAEDGLRELVGNATVDELKAACTFAVEPAPIIAPARLAALEFQVAHNGSTADTVAKLLKEGKPPVGPHGICISLTATELKALIHAYRSVHG